MEHSFVIHSWPPWQSLKTFLFVASEGREVLLSLVNGAPRICSILNVRTAPNGALPCTGQETAPNADTGILGMPVSGHPGLAHPDTCTHQGSLLMNASLAVPAGDHTH